MTCHNCKVEAVKAGHHRAGVQRWKCQQCGKRFQELQQKAFGADVRLPQETVCRTSIAWSKPTPFAERSSVPHGEANRAEHPEAGRRELRAASDGEGFGMFPCAIWSAMKSGLRRQASTPHQARRIQRVHRRSLYLHRPGAHKQARRGVASRQSATWTALERRMSSEGTGLYASGASGSLGSPTPSRKSGTILRRHRPCISRSTIFAGFTVR
jgi:hypothetical protein